jgi:hypothetical protein
MWLDVAGSSGGQIGTQGGPLEGDGRSSRPAATLPYTMGRYVDGTCSIGAAERLMQRMPCGGAGGLLGGVSAELVEINVGSSGAAARQGLSGTPWMIGCCN